MTRSRPGASARRCFARRSTRPPPASTSTVADAGVAGGRPIRLGRAHRRHPGRQGRLGLPERLRTGVRGLLGRPRRGGALAADDGPVPRRGVRSADSRPTGPGPDPTHQQQQQQRPYSATRGSSASAVCAAPTEHQHCGRAAQAVGITPRIAPDRGVGAGDGHVYAAGGAPGWSLSRLVFDELPAGAAAGAAGHRLPRTGVACHGLSLPQAAARREHPRARCGCGCGRASRGRLLVCFSAGVAGVGLGLTRMSGGSRSASAWRKPPGHISSLCWMNIGVDHVRFRTGDRTDRQGFARSSSVLPGHRRPAPHTSRSGHWARSTRDYAWQEGQTSARWALAYYPDTNPRVVTGARAPMWIEIGVDLGGCVVVALVVRLSHALRAKF